MPDVNEELRREAIGWFTRLRSGGATTADLEAFQRWAAQSPSHARAFSDARRLWSGLGDVGFNAAVRLGNETQRRKIDRRMFLTGGAAATFGAAGCLAVRPPFDLWPSFAELVQSDLRTSIGERRHIVLPNDVVVDLNTRTAISVRASEFGTTRVELIAGEGLISGNGVCEVLAGMARVEAAGASFCVRRARDAVRVTCLAGTVSVWIDLVWSTLGAGQQLAYRHGATEAVTHVDVDTITAWRSGQLIFHDTPLAEVVEEANRYRHGRIVIANPKLGSRIVNARIRLDQIDSLVAKIAAAFSARATWLPGGIVILT